MTLSFICFSAVELINTSNLVNPDRYKVASIPLGLLFMDGKGVYYLSPIFNCFRFKTVILCTSIEQLHLSDCVLWFQEERTRPPDHKGMITNSFIFKLFQTNMLLNLEIKCLEESIFGLKIGLKCDVNIFVQRRIWSEFIKRDGANFTFLIANHKIKYYKTNKIKLLDHSLTTELSSSCCQLSCVV